MLRYGEGDVAEGSVLDACLLCRFGVVGEFGMADMISGEGGQGSQSAPGHARRVEDPPDQMKRQLTALTIATSGCLSFDLQERRQEVFRWVD